jgi:hypothetical protein
MDRQCSKCGQTFTPKPGPGRPRLRCEKCRPSEPPRDRQPTLSAPVALPVGNPAPRADLVTSVETELRSAGRDSSPEGVLTVHLAELLSAGGHTASGAAALARELRATLDSALKDATKKADALDELAQRRLQKAAGA